MGASAEVPQQGLRGEPTDSTKAAPIEVSIICPMFNEAAEIKTAIAKLVSCIDALDFVEVLLINDGSRDDTVKRAAEAIGDDPRFRIVSHCVNFGRGRALRTGFREARGRILVTTEGDLSWGAEVVPRMIDHLRANPHHDAVFASPHLPGGGYRNVPWHRVMLSSFGNRILRFLYTGSLTMTTGMTRAYRASAIKPHTFTYDGKELHLEISHRLLILGYRIGEVPAILSWPDPQPGKDSRAKRTNWSKISGVAGSHLAFGVLRGVGHIVAPTLVLLTLAVMAFGGWAIYNLSAGTPSIFLAVLTGILMILWVSVFLGYFMLHHIAEVQKDIWRTQRQLNLMPGAPQDGSGDYYFEEALAHGTAEAHVS